MIKRILATAGIIAATLGTSLGAAGAAGAHVRPLTGLPLCLHADSSKCIVTHGSYNQVTIDTSGAGNFTETVVGTAGNGDHIVEFVDGNGNCLASNDAGTKAVIKPGACSTTNTSENWEEIPVNQGIDDAYSNQLTGTRMGTNSLSAGTGVQVASGLTYTVWQ